MNFQGQEGLMMVNNDIQWLLDFSNSAKHFDLFKNNKEHCKLLAMGLIGEAGSIVSEFKKKEREGNAYPDNEINMREEFGDFLWYFVRFCSVTAPDVLKNFNMSSNESYLFDKFSSFFNFSADVSSLAQEVVSKDLDQVRVKLYLEKIWNLTQSIAHEAGVNLYEASQENTKKITGRWPIEKKYIPLFDNDYAEAEQLPRELTITFSERQAPLPKSRQSSIRLATVKVECNGKEFGNPLNDNIETQDGYRYHDVFHFAYAVYLGWSPIVRKHLGCKRKSNPEIDELQDGLRAAFLEEGISAIIFGQAKLVDFFKEKERVSYDLLKLIQQVVKGFEVEKVPAWQWEKAILEGYKIFRKLETCKGGKIQLKINDTCRFLK